MTSFQCWFILVLVICEGVFSKDNDDESGFIQESDASGYLDYTGPASLASNPIAAKILKVDKFHYPQFFDTVLGRSIDSLGSQSAPVRNVFSSESFGFNPIASKSFHPFKSAKLVAQPQHYQTSSFDQPKPAHASQKLLQYDIQTIHDPNYKVYKPEEQDEGEEILAALKQNPAVAAYFKPPSTSVEISHPIDYRREEQVENPNLTDKNYKANPYLTGPTRIRRYTDGKRRHNKKKRSDEDEDPYNYKADYISRPKAFDSDVYSSAYKQEKDPNNEYEYPYGYDDGYDHKEYDRIKSISEKQAAEIKQNPSNCKEVTKDGMKCVTCKDPKTGGNYESCSYVTEPKNNKYAYSKERKFDSNDEPDEPEQQNESQKPAKYEEAPDSSKSEPKYAELKSEPYKADDSNDNYNAYYVHSSKPKVSEELRSSEDKDSDEKSDSLSKPYNYKAALPGFYTDNEPKKDVEHVLAEFKKKDRSTCNKVQRNGMTCFQCIDKAGLKNEECMFVSESAPKRSHLAYQELKEFTSKPATLNGGSNEGAESQIVTTAATPPQRSAAIVAAPNAFGRKLKRKKVSKDKNLATATTNVVAKTLVPAEAVLTVGTNQPVKAKVVKRSANSQVEAEENPGRSDIAPPEEFSGDSSKGAFWAETMPRYSKTLGVTLPEFMLSKSEHEVSFDETIAGV